MAVLAANVTDDTVRLIEAILTKNEFTTFTRDTKLNLTDKTILIRLALINLQRNLPTIDEVAAYKASLLRPHEFDDYWKELMVENQDV